MRENDFVNWISQLAQSDDNQPLTGIGDDAAVLAATGDDVVVTTDLICDGTHFIAAETDPYLIGRKAMAVNLSDIAAMAARPQTAFVSLLLPRSVSEDDAQQLMRGMTDLAHRHGCVVAGGDTNVWNGALAINVLIIGEVTKQRPLKRSGARPGDALVVTGSLGGSLAGHHLTFEPRIREALQLHSEYNLSAGMDLSDGLALDVRRMATASDCGVVIEADAIPVSTSAREMADSDDEAIERAIGDGEDFELLLALPADEANRLVHDQPLETVVTRIGECVAGNECVLTRNGQSRPLPKLGYEHESDQ